MHLYKVCYVVLIIILLVVSEIIPDRCDTFGYYDEASNYHYVFGIKGVVINFVLFIMLPLLFYGISLAFKLALSDKYVEFTVARLNRNIYYKKAEIIIRRIVLNFLILVSLIVTVYSWCNLGNIIVNDKGFHIQSNGTLMDYTFDYFSNHKLNDDNGKVSFFVFGEYGNSTTCFEQVLYIGKYSPYLEQLLNVLDDKTGGKYQLLKSIQK